MTDSLRQLLTGVRALLVLTVLLGIAYPLLMVGVGAVTAVLAAVGAWFVAGRILRPVRAVADTARAITETDLSARIPPGTSRDEMGALVAAVNAMLDRVEDGAAAQRRFVDDAGHELRTPITIVRGHLDVVDPEDPADVRDAVSLVDDELERMNRIVSDLLVLAKAEQPTFVRPEPTDVEDGLEVVDAQRELRGHVAVVLGLAVAVRRGLPRAVQGPAVSGDDLALVEPDTQRPRDRVDRCPFHRHGSSFLDDI